ncbi:MAG: outer membrane beta-barrel protein [Brevundimonas sp.]|uniref:outer membrane protein n=1 Tax=Brevundimonas sp. TaxID=1871086 RepID=UPI00275E1C2F|nr:outer membrane beta-barrel protein [Brevundimonas sp.]MDP3401161.1 outer membrane beta-barrel protein [Brevundimonas sp.]MDZ4108665.1 outer membrane beta-barrel protein [Brevundimonas sp.]
MRTSLYTGAALATVLMAGLATPALAQSAPNDWSGPYVGIYGSYLETNGDSDERLIFDRDFDGEFDDTVVLNGTTNNAFSPGSCANSARGATLADGCYKVGDGVEAGIRIGYDMQFGNWVVGAVGEVAAADISDSVTSFSTTPASYIMNRDLEHTAALRARVGYAMGPALVYGTGGIAYGKIQNSFFTTNGVNSFTEQTSEDDADGYQYGAGVEWKLAPNLTLVTEYLYTSLEAGDYVVRAGPGTAGPTNPFILPPNTAGTDIARSNGDFDYHGFRLGMNIRF